MASRMVWLSLRLLKDDSETISLIEDAIGKDSYMKGELAGIEKRQKPP